MLCLSGFELYSRWVPLSFQTRYSNVRSQFKNKSLFEISVDPSGPPMPCPLSRPRPTLFTPASRGHNLFLLNVRVLVSHNQLIQ